MLTPTGHVSSPVLLSNSTFHAADATLCAVGLGVGRVQTQTVQADGALAYCSARLVSALGKEQHEICDLVPRLTNALMIGHEKDESEMLS